MKHLVKELKRQILRLEKEIRLKLLDIGDWRVRSFPTLDKDSRRFGSLFDKVAIPSAFMIMMMMTMVMMMGIHEHVWKFM